MTRSSDIDPSPFSTDLQPITDTVRYVETPAAMTYFDGVVAHGVLHGVGQVTLSANRLGLTPEGQFLNEVIPVSHLRGSLPALKRLHESLSTLIAALEPARPGQSVN